MFFVAPRSTGAIASHLLSMRERLDAVDAEYELRWLSGRGHIGAHFDRPAGTAALHFLDRHLHS